MVKKDFQQAISDIRAGDVAAIYVVHGTEKYLSEWFNRVLQQSVVSDEDEMNIMHFDMTETLLSEAMLEANSLPFFGDKRLVIVDQPYFLTGAKPKQSLEHNIKELEQYIEQPLDSTVLVFNAPYEKLDGRKKVVKQLNKQAVVVDVQPMQERDVRQFVKQHIQNDRYQVTPKALETLLVLCQMDLSRIMGELNKLYIAGINDYKITKPMVEELVAKSLEQNVFDLITFVMKKQPNEALKLYEELLLQGEETIKMNAILIGHVRLLIQVNVMQQKHYQQPNMVDVLKVHPYRIKLAQQEARRMSLGFLMNLYDELVENDYRMKTGQMDKELLFQLFILKFSQK